MARTAKPGWYPAEGDPEGTSRHWDGSKWDSEPTILKEMTEPGDLVRRLGAVAIDFVVWLAIGMILLLIGFLSQKSPLDIPESEKLGRILFSVAIQIGLLFLFFGLPIRRFGKTWGKRLAGLEIRARTCDPAPPGWGPTLLRFALLYAAATTLPVSNFLVMFSVGISVFLTSLVMIVVHPERLSLFDLVSGTRVVHPISLKNLQLEIPMMEDI